MHEIEIVDGQARMYYAADRGLPWHQLGQAAATAVTSEEAIEKAGLNWDVELGEVWGGPKLTDANRDDPNRLTQIPGRHVIRRVIDGHILDITRGDRYQPIQNREAFAFLDSLVEDHIMRYESAGSLKGGRRIWLLCRLEDDMEVAGDKYVKYLCLTSAHDGFGGMQIFPTLVRVVCMNTLGQAISAASQERMVNIVHSGDVMTKLGMAQSILKITTSAMRRYQEWLNQLVDIEVPADKLTAVKDDIFEPLDTATPTQRRKAIEAFQSIYDAEKVLHGDSAYTLVQTATGYADHIVRVQYKGTGDERMISALGGTIHNTKVKMLNSIGKVLDLSSLTMAAADIDED